jgi:hypothetical protein
LFCGVNLVQRSPPAGLNARYATTTWSVLADDVVNVFVCTFMNLNGNGSIIRGINGIRKYVITLPLALMLEDYS